MVKEYNRGIEIRKEITLSLTTLPPLTDATIGDHIDTDFICQQEGYSLQGYVPLLKGVPLGQSGVTVACGFDLGQRTYQDLLSLGLPQPLIAKLKPYVKLKKWDAYNLVKKTPLTLTDQEVADINKIVFTQEVRGIIDLVGEDRWEKLGRSMRTVLTSVQFQYGDVATKTPQFFKQVMSMNVPSVIKVLENFGDAYSSRRKREANYLQLSYNQNDGEKNI